MLSVKGTFRNGTAHPIESVEGHEGEPVLITFPEDGPENGRSEDRDGIQRRAKELELWDQLFSRKLSMGPEPMALDLSDLSGDDLLF